MPESANRQQLYVLPETIFLAGWRDIQTNGSTEPHAIVVGAETNLAGKPLVVVAIARFSGTNGIKRWQLKPGRVTWDGRGRGRMAHIRIDDPNPDLRCDLWLPTVANQPPDCYPRHNRAGVELLTNPNELASLGLGNLAIQQYFPRNAEDLRASIPPHDVAALNGHSPTS